MALESLSQHTHLDIEATSTVERLPVDAPPDSAGWTTLQDPAVRDRTFEWLMLSRRTRPGEGVDALADSVRGSRPLARRHTGCARLLHDEMTYEPGSTAVHSSGEQAWAERRGVCQDFAHIAVGALRSLGIPARYVSGYLAPKRDSEVGETSVGESHAWVEFWDGAWLPADPTNVRPVGLEHVVVARGRDYEDVPPLWRLLRQGCRDARRRGALHPARLSPTVRGDPGTGRVPGSPRSADRSGRGSGHDR